MTTHARTLAAAYVAMAAAVALGCSRRQGANRTTAPAASSAKPAPAGPAPAPPAARPSGPVRFVAIGGGAAPESTEVSLEQDIDLVARTLPPPGLILFAGGRGSLSVREEDEEPHGDRVLVELGALFRPRTGRRSHYTPVSLPAGRASLESVEDVLDSTLSRQDGPLLLYIAAHGDQGESRRDNAVALWGGQALTVAHLAEIHERHTRPLRLVVTSCFSGGFAELAFEHADEHRGPSRVPRCGVFAGTWDRETSGCDPNPDRKEQESYGLHFIHALAGKDRDGHPLDPNHVDFDRDGKVGLLDAHTRASIDAMSLDVPTTTSERYLRSVERGSAPIDRKLLPEDAAVVDQLGAALGLRDEASVDERWKELDARISHLDDTLDDADDALAAKEATLGSRLLERWPVLDDAYHPDFAAMLRDHHDAIAEVLEQSPEARERREAQRKVDAADTELAELEVKEARVLRLRRAYETLHLAAALMRRGGPQARYYSSLLACERAAP